MAHHDHGAGDHEKVFDKGLGGGLAKEFLKADHVYTVNFTELNESGIEAGAFLAVRGDKLTVVTFADNVEAGQLHVQHIHGFLGVKDAMTPTDANDTDGDGFIELLEGLPSYGPIQVNLDPFPTPEGDRFFYAAQFDLDDFPGLTAENLDEHEIVIHGLSVGDAGAGTDGEVNGMAGYKTVLPIASGEIVEIEALRGVGDIARAMAEHGCHCGGGGDMHLFGH
ncbi:MAG TPA: hypothetical protein VD970_10350 [Acetobacteraceae bacterium]|nr:hypothetical protein [Acetobacteraceae bacterium]